MGHFFEYPWGNAAVLEDQLANCKNICEFDGIIFAWVGDLVSPLSAKDVDEILETLNQPNNENLQLHRECFTKLNGAFACLIATQNQLVIITDPMAYTQVFIHNEVSGDPESIYIGTHLETIAAVSGEKNHLDHVSLAEFLNAGTTTFPHTTYKHVKEMRPGTIHCFEFNNQRLTRKSMQYWTPPAEDRTISEEQLADDLRKALVASVQDRIKNHHKVGIALSGGLDSRLIMALVPESKECIGLTLCDHENRETRTAMKVSQCYGRPWYPLQRSENYLADCLLQTTRLIGCDFDWINAHGIAAAEQFFTHNIDVLLNGMEIDAYLKAHFAVDFIKHKRLWGLRPPEFKHSSYDFAHQLTSFSKSNLKINLVHQIYDRKQKFLAEFLQKNRTSQAEWLHLYPFSQNKIGACWSAERRVLNQKFVAFDRRILDVAFRCPVNLKFNKKFFLKSTLDLYGSGKYIPSADNGVTPASKQVNYLIQRVIRKSQDKGTKLLNRFGKNTLIQHSWHDYQDYWQSNQRIIILIDQYASRLNRLNETVFNLSGSTLIKSNNLHWQDGFRLLQLAVWLNKFE